MYPFKYYIGALLIRLNVEKTPQKQYVPEILNIAPLYYLTVKFQATTEQTIVTAGVLSALHESEISVSSGAGGGHVQSPGGR